MEKECCTCKHEDLSEHDFPCSKCRNIYNPTYEQEAYNKTPLLWESAQAEEINHPPRYKHGEYECIDVMADVFGKEAVQNFCLLSAFKYVWRKDYKGGVQDIRKAMWCLDKYVELEGEAHDE